MFDTHPSCLTQGNPMLCSTHTPQGNPPGLNYFHTPQDKSYRDHTRTVCRRCMRSRFWLMLRVRLRWRRMRGRRGGRARERGGECTTHSTIAKPKKEVIPIGIYASSNSSSVHGTCSESNTQGSKPAPAPAYAPAHGPGTAPRWTGPLRGSYHHLASSCLSTHNFYMHIVRRQLIWPPRIFM